MLVRYKYEKGELLKICKDAEEKCNAEIEKMLSIPRDERTFSNTVEAFENAVADYSDSVSDPTFMNCVSTDELIRKESSECDEIVSKYLIGLSTRRDIYLVFKDFISSKNYNPDELSPVQRRLLDVIMLGFRRSGMELPDDKLDAFRRINEDLSQLSIKFSANLNENNDSVEFTPEELDGVPDSFLERLTTNESGKYVIPMKRTFYEPLMENARNQDVRKRAFIVYMNKEADSNTPLLERAIQLRYELAQLMGYDNYVDFAVENQMAKNSGTIQEFLDTMRNRIRPRYLEELDVIRKLKLDDTGNRYLNPWDFQYYYNKLKKMKYGVDDDVVKEYFPLDIVLGGMFKIYSKILGVEFREIANADVWADGVKLFENVSDGEVVSYFYMDLYPRPGKYGHAAAFTLTGGRMKDGKYVKPVSAIVANFTAPTKDKPSLLSHSEVEILFHEFGHIMHQTLTTAPYTRLSGTRTTTDFVEAPSQVMENWVWEKEMLDLISGHYRDVSKKLPNDLLQKMIDSKLYNTGYFYMRQNLLGTLDFVYHTSGPVVDTTAIYVKLFKDVLDVDIPVTKFQAAFGHLLGGYGAKYYGYMWSKVFAQDMFTLFVEHGLMNSDIGMSYRKNILERGYEEDPDILLRNFLGRESRIEPFLKSIGIGPSLSQ